MEIVKSFLDSVQAVTSKVQDRLLISKVTDPPILEHYTLKGFSFLDLPYALSATIWLEFTDLIGEGSIQLVGVAALVTGINEPNRFAWGGKGRQNRHFIS